MFKFKDIALKKFQILCKGTNVTSKILVDELRMSKDFVDMILCDHLSKCNVLVLFYSFLLSNNIRNAFIMLGTLSEWLATTQIFFKPLSH